MKSNQFARKTSGGCGVAIISVISGLLGLVLGLFTMHLYHSGSSNAQLRGEPQQHVAQVELPPIRKVVTVVQYIQRDLPPIVLSSECDAYINQYVAGNRSLASRRLKDRADIPNLLNDMGLLGTAVEVGVRDGDHSFWILSHWKGKMLYMVDPWIEQDSKVYNDISNVSDAFLCGR